jgi:hypothetical protein
MRAAPLPLLRDLPPFLLIIRCIYCGALVRGEELCADRAEAAGCKPPRVLHERPGLDHAR